MSAENALMKAVYARLAGDAALVAQVGADGVRDRLLPRMRLPAIVFGEMETRDYSTATEPGAEHFWTIEVWAEGEGRRAAEVLAARVRLLLANAALTLDGFVLVNLTFQSSRSRREPKTKFSVIDLRFRAVTE
jgi:predicted dienelactone hydrolase